MNPQKLCIALLKCDSEEEVIKILTDAGYWNDRESWSYFGNNENNFSVIGAQQSHPHPALVEKLVNSVDATLMGHCYENGYAPDSDGAPKNMRAAVSRFFEEGDETIPKAGLIRNWSDKKRNEISQLITLVTTGKREKPCITIADAGEGQTPESMPNTLLSIGESNKLRIPFVQGKFNMGGTGVLSFCGQENFQLIISKRNPKAIHGDSQDTTEWGFTIVRREDPEEGCRSSVFTYLAPLGKDKSPREGGVLRFVANALPIFPEPSKDKIAPYSRLSEWGTVIKL